MLRLSFWTNFLSQWWQLNGFSPMWSLSCTLRSSFWMIFFVTVVAIEWLFSNALSGCPSGRSSYHSGGSWMVFHQCEAFHALSGCPSGWISCHSGGNWMAVLKCALRLSFWTNFLSQWWQLNGFSPVWILSCTLRLSFWMSFLSQLNCNKQGFHQMTGLNDFTSQLDSTFQTECVI